MLKRILTLSALCLGVLNANAATFKEGVDYTLVKNPEPISGNVIVVREFFWYGCPHCYALEPHTARWAKTKPNDVAFFRTPAVMRADWEPAARAFYAAQAMQQEERLHGALFEAIHKNNTRLVTEADYTNWYVSQGLDRATFRDHYHSFAVNTKVNRSKEGAKRYGLMGTPAVVVHGKYVISGANENAPEIINHLIEKTRSELN